MNSTTVAYLLGLATLPVITATGLALLYAIAPSDTTKLWCEYCGKTWRPNAKHWPWWVENLVFRAHKLGHQHRNSPGVRPFRAEPPDTPPPLTYEEATGKTSRNEAMDGEQ